jgi:hypothetical protein
MSEPVSQVVESVGPYSYKNDYSHFLRFQESGCISLIPLVGAGRFERPTPCAQGRCATRLRYAPTSFGSLIIPFADQRVSRNARRL